MSLTHFEHHLCYRLTHIVECLWKATIVKQAETAVDRERLCKLACCQAMAATHTHVIIEGLLEAVFPVRSCIIYITRSNCRCRTVEWCEMAASLRGRKRGWRGTSAVWRSYQAGQWRQWLRTLFCMIVAVICNLYSKVVYIVRFIRSPIKTPSINTISPDNIFTSDQCQIRDTEDILKQEWQ